jgi:Sel1 repeat
VAEREHPRSGTTPASTAAVKRDAAETPYPSVSGPSFLGLDNPEAGAEYLLEEEGSSRRGLRVLLLLILLAAIVALAIVQYRSSLNGSPKSPRPPDPSPATIPNSEGQNRRPAHDGKPVHDDGLQTASAAHSLGTAVAALSKAANANPPPPVQVNVEPKEASIKRGGKQSDDAGEDGSGKQLASNKTGTPPSPALIRAQQFLHGQGVRRNCEQGLIYLRAAARENDPEAAIQMGALYTSGVCVERDRVKAYEWFSTAHNLEPDNRWIAKNLNQLRVQMTPQERRQIHE